MTGYPQLNALAYSYTGFAAGQGDNSFPGTQLDNDLANLHAGIASANAFIESAFRSDGTLNVTALPTTSAVAAQLQGYVDSASASVTSAAASATSASGSATAASTQATAAANSAASAATSASAAATSATNAASAVAGQGALASLNVVDVAQLTAAVQAMLVPTGAFQMFMLAAAPMGWVEVGTTIGPVGSGANRANADTQALFNALWASMSDTTAPLLTSGGGATTRGASAAADWNAGKRLTVTDTRGEFIRALDRGRGIDVSRVLGTDQTDAFQGHAHDLTLGHTGVAILDPASPGAFASGGSWSLATVGTASGAPVANGGNGTPRTATETRPRNIALLACVKL